MLFFFALAAPQGLGLKHRVCSRGFSPLRLSSLGKQRVGKRRTREEVSEALHAQRGLVAAVWDVTRVCPHEDMVVMGFMGRWFLFADATGVFPIGLCCEVLHVSCPCGAQEWGEVGWGRGGGPHGQGSSPWAVMLERMEMALKKCRGPGYLLMGLAFKSSPMLIMM